MHNVAAMLSTAAAQPLPAASAPAQAAPSPALATSAPARPASAAQTATVPVTPAYNAITVQLQPEAKPTSWLDPALLGPLVAALAILGTYIGTARNTNKQLKAARDTSDRQMQNARDQARLDRTLASRKVNFDTFIDDFKRCAHLIGDLPNRDFANAGLEIAELSDMNATVNKIWLWAEVQTVFEVRSLGADINELFMEGMVECQPVWLIQKKIKRIRGVLARVESERDEAARAIRQFKQEYDEEGRRLVANQSAEQDLHRQFANAASGASSGHRDLNEHLAEETKLRREYLNFIAKRQPLLMGRMNHLMGTARKELEVAGDTTILDQQTEDMKQRVSEAIRRVQLKLNE